MIVLFPFNESLSGIENISWKQAVILPSEPVLTPDKSWEIPRTNLYGSVLKVDQQFEMFYQCANAIRVGRAVSADGKLWKKPLINKTDLSKESEGIQLAPVIAEEDGTVREESKGAEYIDTNLVAGAHMPSVMYVENDAKPYKLFAFGANGFITYESVDGKLFDVFADPAIELARYENEETGKNWCSDVAPCYVELDKQGRVERYVAMTKTYEMDEQKRTRRCVGRSESADFKCWSKMQTLWVPGEREDRIAQSRGFNWADFYGLCPFKYGTGYLGFLWLFEIEHELPTGTHQGKMEVFLVSSKDALSWDYVSEEPFIPWDLNYGGLGGMVTTASQPVFEEQEIKIYYSDNNYEHGYTEADFKKKIESPVWVTRCAQIKKERLVGAFSEDGFVRLNLGSLDKKMLRINADTSAGSLIVNYIKSGKVIASHTIEGLDDTDIFVEPMGEGVERLQLCLQNATLYALEVI